MTRQHVHFVTGRLAEHSLRNVLTTMSEEAQFEFSISVLPITVAALMTPEWIAKRISPPPHVDRVLVPGYCEGDLASVAKAAGAPVERGPRDLRQLPAFFGQPNAKATDYGDYDIEIIAEINHCPRLSLSEILAEASQLKADGADVIDVGCDPGTPWAQVGETVRALRDTGHRVSIDSFDPKEVSSAIEEGAELVLSVNSSNRDAARDWGCEVVAIPDDPESLSELDTTIELLAKHGIPLRIDPVLEPIGFGFAASLGRYIEVRRRYCDAEIMMGIGNLSELTDADSAAINVTLLGICQELGIRSVLTTQVIPWARSSVKECDLARRLVYHAITQKTLPKHLEPGLIMLRDERAVQITTDELDQLAEAIKDNNYRLFVADEKIHLVSAGLHLVDEDAFVLFDRLLKTGPTNVDAAHAFYLGYELAKATTARTLSKNYQQDESLDWGLLTEPETSHRLTRTRPKRPARGDDA
jgi:dihydropteroate synthase-like protein